MANKRHKPEEIVTKQRQVDVLVGCVAGPHESTNLKFQTRSAAPYDGRSRLTYWVTSREIPTGGHKIGVPIARFSLRPRRRRS